MHLLPQLKLGLADRLPVDGHVAPGDVRAKVGHAGGRERLLGLQLYARHGVVAGQRRVHSDVAVFHGQHRIGPQIGHLSQFFELTRASLQGLDAGVGGDCVVRETVDIAGKRERGENEQGVLPPNGASVVVAVAVRVFRWLGHEVHTALRARTGLLGGDFRVHGAHEAVRAGLRGRLRGRDGLRVGGVRVAADGTGEDEEKGNAHRTSCTLPVQDACQPIRRAYCGKWSQPDGEYSQVRVEYPHNRETPQGARAASHVANSSLSSGVNTAP